MKKIAFLPLFIILFLVLLLFHPLFLRAEVPVPSDTILVLYHPFIDYAARHFSNGVQVKNILITDPVRQQYPWRWLAVSIERSVQLPIWNPYSFAGTPLLANFQTAAFYPLNIILFIFPFWLGWSILVFLQPVLAGLFLYFYLRRMKVSEIASLLGGFVFAFCGFATAWLEWNNVFQTALWLPLILLAKEYLLEKITIKWMAVLIFAQCAAFFAGFLQIFFYMLLLHNSYLVARIIQITRAENKKEGFWKRVWKKYYPFVLQGLIIIAITSIQWLPTLQFIVLSNRNVDLLNNWKLSGWFIPWQNLVQFFAPDFFGNPTTQNYWGIWNYGEFIGYVGIFPLIMALFALFYRRDRKTFYFGTFFFLSLIFSLPTIFAKIPYFLNIPFFSTSQPTRLLFLTDFCLSILAALGFDYYLQRIPKKIVYPIIFVFIIFLGLWYFVFLGYSQLHIPQDDSIITKHNLYFPTIIFFASALLFSCLIFLENKKTRYFIIFGMLSLTFFDLFRFSSKFTAFTQLSYLFPQTHALSYLQMQQGQFRIMATSSELLPPNVSIMYHLQSLDGYDPLYPRRYSEIISAINQNNPDNALPADFHRIITPQATSSRLIDLFGVKYILTLSDQKDPKLKKVFSEGETNIYENKQAFPRVFYVQNVKPVIDKSEAIKLLFDPRIDIQRTVVVEGWDVHQTHFENGTAKIIDYQANKIEINTQSTKQTFLVLTDTFYPTWHVKVDNKEEKIYQTDYNFRGIVIQPGNHHVIFYDSLL